MYLPAAVSADYVFPSTAIEMEPMVGRQSFFVSPSVAEVCLSNKKEYLLMKKENTRILKGDICFSESKNNLISAPDHYLVCEDGICRGIFPRLPEKYTNLPVEDHTGKLIVPGLIDLHLHAPQYAFRGFQMDLELLDWLDSSAFPEEANYQDLAYAEKAYSLFVQDLKKSPTTRACLFASLHVPATILLMDLLEKANLEAYVGKVNMDRNCPSYLCEESDVSVQDTISWLQETTGKYSHVHPILTPRFIPACSDRLMTELAEIAKQWKLPMQSHLSENPEEIRWVKELAPQSRFYGDAYYRFGLFGGDIPTIMAHCVHCPPEEIDLIAEQGVFVAHCPQSNSNLISGAAPARLFLDRDIHIGLASDIAGGASISIFRAMADAIQVSKLRARLVDSSLKPLTLEEVFFMGTKGGGSFFGKVGSFEEGYEMDALVLDESSIPHPQTLDIRQRLERYVYLAGEDWVLHKYIKGEKLF